MIAENLQWDDEYNIGVKAIDEDHQEFLRIMRRLMQLSHNPGKHKWVGEEGIKFLKQYAVKHFDREEAYMRSICYPGLAGHKLQHETLKREILPKLEAQLRHSRYSQEAIEKFLNVMRIWLSRHIQVHDKAIGWAGASPA